MYIADLHCDSLLTVSSEQGLINEYNFSREYPQLQLTAAFIPKGNEAPEERRRRLMRFMDIYISECSRLGLVNVISCHDLAFAVAVEKRAAMFTVEGGGGLFAESEELRNLYRMGLRLLGPIWDTNELGCSAWEKNDTGLTNDGKELVERCSEMGIIIDVSHMSDKAFYDTLEVSGYPVVATHSNFRELCSSPRNLTLDMARRIAARGGVIGMNLYPDFLADDGSADPDAVFRQVDFALERLGEDTLALGLDIDGTDGKYPAGISTKSSIHDQLTEALSARYGDRIAEKIAGENAISFLKSNL